MTTSATTTDARRVAGTVRALVGLCDACGGECCKFVSIPLAEIPGLLPELDRPWLEARGTLYPDGTWRIPSRCRHLTDSGRCAIYATRPESCRDYEVDGASCRRARSEANAGGERTACPKGTNDNN